MKYRVVPYTHKERAKVRLFNSRIKQSPLKAQMRESPELRWFPKVKGSTLYQERYVVLDKHDEVRGGYMLKFQDFKICDRIVNIGDIQQPISEGIVNKKYVVIAQKVIADALKRSPFLYGLGMGGLDQPLPKLLDVLGWHLFPVPFYFKVIHPVSFFNNIEVLRKNKIRKILFSVIAYSGLGYFGIKLVQFIKSKRLPPSSDISCSEETCFSEWADTIWEESKGYFDFIAVRDAKSLSLMYPKEKQRYIILLIKKNQDYLGWALVLNTKMKGHKQFGNMKVGTIVDYLCKPCNTKNVLFCAQRWLIANGADVIVTNQNYCFAKEFFISRGYFSGPSNFIFASSKSLSEVLNVQDDVSRFHINRGDGDGPINL